MPNIKPHALKTQQQQRASKRNLIFPSREPNGILTTSHNNWTKRDKENVDKEMVNDSGGPLGEAQGNGAVKKQVRIKGDISTYQDAKRHREIRLRSAHKKRELQAIVSMG